MMMTKVHVVSLRYQLEKIYSFFAVCDPLKIKKERKISPYKRLRV